MSWETSALLAFGVAAKPQGKKQPHRNAASAHESEEDDQRLRYAATKKKRSKGGARACT